MQNTGNVDCPLMDKLTLFNVSDGSRILPAYYSDNYVSLLPGEKREIEIAYPAKAANGAAQLAIRGWNIHKQAVPVTLSEGKAN